MVVGQSLKTLNASVTFCLVTLFRWKEITAASTLGRLNSFPNPPQPSLLGLRLLLDCCLASVSLVKFLR